MEHYAHLCRFILACNYSGKIILPIQSRTAVFRCQRLSREEMKRYLEKVVSSENITIIDTALEALIHVSEGDMRKAVNILQTAAVTTSNKQGKLPSITKEHILSVTSNADPERVQRMLMLSIEGKFKEARK